MSTPYNIILTKWVNYNISSVIIVQKYLAEKKKFYYKLVHDMMENYRN